MPIYEFDCQDCGEPFEELVLSSAAIDRVECPNCRSREIIKKVSLIGSAGSNSSSVGISPAACTTST
jgi:putative FmdB family regulatory protein